MPLKIIELNLNDIGNNVFYFSLRVLQFTTIFGYNRLNSCYIHNHTQPYITITNN